MPTVFCINKKGYKSLQRLTKEALQALIDEQPLRSLSSIGAMTGHSRGAFEKLLKTYQLEDYRNRKIKRLRGPKARKRRDIQN